MWRPAQDFSIKVQGKCQSLTGTGGKKDTSNEAQGTERPVGASSEPRSRSVLLVGVGKAGD